MFLPCGSTMNFPLFGNTIPLRGSATRDFISLLLLINTKSGTKLCCFHVLVLPSPSQPCLAGAGAALASLPVGSPNILAFQARLDAGRGGNSLCKASYKCVKQLTRVCRGRLEEENPLKRNPFALLGKNAPCPVLAGSGQSKICVGGSSAVLPC